MGTINSIFKLAFTAYVSMSLLHLRTPCFTVYYNNDVLGYVTCKYTYIHMHAHTHVYTHAYIQTHTYTCVYIDTPTDIHYILID